VSIDRYDPTQGASLEQYAWTRIHGAVLDELRHNDWAPRSIRRWDRDINQAWEQFIALHGRHPTRAELSDSPGVAKDELAKRQHDIAAPTSAR
jgi:RNA polymerase sigma factor FliA